MIPRYVASLVLAGSILAVACIDMSAPNGPASISNLILPSPSVIVGDTMRDATGAVAPLRVISFDINNVPIAGTTTELFIQDTAPAARLGPDAKLVGKRIGSVHILGQVNQLQTPAATIPVTYRPTSVTPAVAVPLIVPLSGDSTDRGKTTAITVTVLGGKDSASQGIIVRYQIDSAPASADPKFPAVYLINPDDSKPSMVDTTDPAGVATRLLSGAAAQFAPGAIPGTVVVTVFVSYAGATVPGAPVTFRVPVQLGTVDAATLVPLRRPMKGDILAPLRSQRGNRWARAVVPGILRPEH